MINYVISYYAGKKDSQLLLSVWGDRTPPGGSNQLLLSVCLGSNAGWHLVTCSREGGTQDRERTQVRARDRTRRGCVRSRLTYADAGRL
jgi:hypothetical protein